MAWTYLFIAGILEVCWAAGMRYTEGFTKFWPTLATISIIIVDMILLSRAVKTLPIGTAYAVWTGIGAAGTALVGIALFHELPEARRLVCIALIIVGIVGLRLTATP
jgi:quaternary ammonium compound-resistance protein SugE